MSQAVVGLERRDRVGGAAKMGLKDCFKELNDSGMLVKTDELF